MLKKADLLQIVRATFFVILGLCSSAAFSIERYQAVIDAGSSGNRVYLYKLSVHQDRLHVETLLAFRSSNSKGLSAYSSDPEQAGSKEIAPLIRKLETTLAARHIDKNHVSISVLATAGMRLLPEAESKLIFHNVRREIRDQGFHIESARIISGQEEGIFAWIDLNYSRDRLRPGQQTLGIIEIGGASSQVAFASADHNTENNLPFTINGQHYQVVSISYLGLGHNEARRSMMGLLSTHHSGPNPCYPNSQQPDVTYDLGRVKGQMSQFNASCFDWYARVIADVGRRSTNQPVPQQLREIPGFSSTPFIGLASIKHVFEQWTMKDLTVPKVAMRQAILDHCSGADAWESLKGLKGSRSLIQNACANASYLYALLFSSAGLGLSNQQFETIEQLQKDGLTWTRGFVLFQAANMD